MVSNAWSSNQVSISFRNAVVQQAQAGINIFANDLKAYDKATNKELK